jgi:hypothetical protein
MHSCNLLTDAVQVDLRFNAYFGDYLWVPMPEDSSISVVKSGLCAAGRQGFNHPKLRITILRRTSCIFPSFIDKLNPRRDHVSCDLFSSS